MRLREIKNKINLTRNISQITRALELVSAVKMKKALQLAMGSRPFAKKVVEILGRLSGLKEVAEEFPFYFEFRKVKKILAIVMSSDRGFCGLYNKSILRFAEKDIEEVKKEGEVEILAIGKKTKTYFERRNYKLIGEFTGFKDFGELGKVKPIADLLFRYYQEDRYQKICFYCTHYFTPFFQLPRKIQVLPLKREVFEEMLRKIIGEIIIEKGWQYIFEPSLKEIFEGVVRSLVEFEIYHAILEANASEHAARMMAMRRATDSAKEIVERLTLEYNKARQTQITAEVCEITSAKEATV